MTILEIGHYAFVNNCSIKFRTIFNQMEITVSMFEDTDDEVNMSQCLPLDNHMRNEKVKDCIDFCVAKLKENL